MAETELCEAAEGGTAIQISFRWLYIAIFLNLIIDLTLIFEDANIRSLKSP